MSLSGLILALTLVLAGIALRLRLRPAGASMRWIGPLTAVLSAIVVAGHGLLAHDCDMASCAPARAHRSELPSPTPDCR